MAKNLPSNNLLPRKQVLPLFSWNITKMSQDLLYGMFLRSLKIPMPDFSNIYMYLCIYMYICIHIYVCLCIDIVFGYMEVKPGSVNHRLLVFFSLPAALLPSASVTQPGVWNQQELTETQLVVIHNFHY